MFDGAYSTFYHGYYTSPQPECEDGGAIITFKSLIKYVDLRIFTRRHNCCNDRYKNVCLYADTNKISCTPSDFAAIFGSEINFKDYNPDGSLSDGLDTEIYAREFILKWEAPQCAQIAELYIDYQGKSYFCQYTITNFLPRISNLYLFFTLRLSGDFVDNYYAVLLGGSKLL